MNELWQSVKDLLEDMQSAGLVKDARACLGNKSFLSQSLRTSSSLLAAVVVCGCYPQVARILR